LDLQFRVAGNRDNQGFLNIGERCANDVRTTLQRLGRPLKSFRRILDFGCGCGRTIRWLDRMGWRTQLYGSDVDGDAISWCQKYIRFAKFACNGHKPPLPFPDKTFDLVYSISIFSHLRADYAVLWLAEIARVLRPGGMALLTTHGTVTIAMAAPPIRTAIEENRGSFFAPEPMWEGIFPDWYGTSYYTEAAARERMGDYFEVADYSAGGLCGFQDIIALRPFARTSLTSAVGATRGVLSGLC